jgi:hypothetical protein
VLVAAYQTLSNRSAYAIDRQLERRVDVGHKKSVVGHVNAEDVTELDETIRRYVGTFRQICADREFSRDEIERFKALFQAASKYRELFLAHEEVRAVDQCLAETGEMVKALQATVRLREPRDPEVNLKKVCK